ncbi:MAG: AtpZ/AtpI family protein [Deltaproteobacteria bacterium]|nr:AtpZ/AtpI family protein [Deltaproteobacteria bacterium]
MDSPPPPGGEKKKKGPGLAEIKLLALVSSIGLAMVLSVFFGLILGYYADRWLGTKPWLLLLGLLVGIAAAFNNLIIMTRRMEKQRSRLYGGEESRRGLDKDRGRPGGGGKRRNGD